VSCHQGRGKKKKKKKNKKKKKKKKETLFLTAHQVRIFGFSQKIVLLKAVHPSTGARFVTISEV
jgi:hypothetical protein